TATFLLQLFLIPLLIVSIVVALWLLFSWMAHMGGENPQELVKAIAKGDNTSWQRAYELADLLRSPDPRYDALRRDSKLARELAAFLDKDLNVAAKGEGDSVRVKGRMFLCRALGEFAISDGLGVLMRAAKEERDPVEVQVRLAALEAITTLAHNCRPQSFEANGDLVQLLLAASREPDDSGPAPATTRDGQPTTYRPHAEIRAVAAFALGVIGGGEAQARLKVLLINAFPNAPYK